MTDVLERTKYNGDDPVTAGPLEVEASRVRLYLERCMREAPDGSRAKDEAKAAYVAFAGVSISARAGTNFAPMIAKELGEAQATMTLFMQSMDRARDLWHAHGGDRDIHPDNATLVAWLLGHVATLSRELDKALAIRPAVVRMSEKFTGPSLSVNVGRDEEEEPEDVQPQPVRKRVRKPRSE